MNPVIFQKIMADPKLMSFEELQKKVMSLKENRGVDLSTDEDLSIAVMNLISLEEHFFFSGAKTKKDEYYDMLKEVREMRKILLARMIDKTEGESWCISKHLLGTTMRLMEVGTNYKGMVKQMKLNKCLVLPIKFTI